MDGEAEMTHLVTRDQKQTVFFTIKNLSGDNVQDQEFTPAAVQQLHLITDLETQKEELTSLFLFFMTQSKQSQSLELFSLLQRHLGRKPSQTGTANTPQVSFNWIL